MESLFDRFGDHLSDEGFQAKQGQIPPVSG
jgi:hypothetical protein